MNINNIILDLINCWNHGELKYLDRNETATFSDFITMKKKKKWKSAKCMIKNITDNGDKFRSNFFEPFILDKYTVDDLIDNNKFKWIINNNEIWILLIDNHISCDHIIPILYSNKNKELHLLLNKFTNILFKIYKDYRLNINNKINNFNYFKTTNKLYNLLKNNNHLLNVESAGDGYIKKKNNKYYLFINNNYTNYVNKNNHTNSNNNYIKKFKNLLSKLSINNLTICNYNKTKKKKIILSTK